MNTGPFQVGDRIDGYQLSGLLGEGGLGLVFRARQLSLERDVALKVMREEALPSHAWVSRFLREIEIQKGLEHPHLVKVIDAGVHAGRPFLVMELVEGGRLLEMATLQQWTVGRRIGALRDVSLALDHLHQRRIVHRDLKPANVMVTTDGGVKLMDLGLARSEEHTLVTQADQLLGTMAYWSPELVTGEVVGEPADVYALGLCAFELFAGRLPYHADNQFAWIHVIQTVTPPRLSDLVPVPPAVDQLVADLLEKEPARRPTASEAASRLAQAGAHEPARTSRAGAPRPRKSAPERHSRRTMAGVLAGVCALLIGLMSGVVFLTRVPTTRNPAATDSPRPGSSGALRSKVPSRIGVLERASWAESSHGHVWLLTARPITLIAHAVSDGVAQQTAVDPEPTQTHLFGMPGVPGRVLAVTVSSITTDPSIQAERFQLELPTREVEVHRAESRRRRLARAVEDFTAFLDAELGSGSDLADFVHHAGLTREEFADPEGEQLLLGLLTRKDPRFLKGVLALVPPRAGAPLSTALADVLLARAPAGDASQARFFGLLPELVRCLARRPDPVARGAVETFVREFPRSWGQSRGPGTLQVRPLEWMLALREAVDHRGHDGPLNPAALESWDPAAAAFVAAYSGERAPALEQRLAHRGARDAHALFAGLCLAGRFDLPPEAALSWLAARAESADQRVLGLAWLASAQPDGWVEALARWIASEEARSGSPSRLIGIELAALSTAPVSSKLLDQLAADPDGRVRGVVQRARAGQSLRRLVQVPFEPAAGLWTAPGISPAYRSVMEALVATAREGNVPTRTMTDGLISPRALKHVIGPMLERAARLSSTAEKRLLVLDALGPPTRTRVHARAGDRVHVELVGAGEDGGQLALPPDAVWATVQIGRQRREVVGRLAADGRLDWIDEFKAMDDGEVLLFLGVGRHRQRRGVWLPYPDAGWTSCGLALATLKVTHAP